MHEFIHLYTYYNIKIFKYIDILQICLMLLYYFTGDFVLFYKFCADSPRPLYLLIAIETCLLYISWTYISKPNSWCSLSNLLLPQSFPPQMGTQFNYLLQAKNLSVIVDNPFSHGNEDISRSLPLKQESRHTWSHF